MLENFSFRVLGLLIVQSRGYVGLCFVSFIIEKWSLFVFVVVSQGLIGCGRVVIACLRESMFSFVLMEMRVDGGDWSVYGLTPMRNAGIALTIKNVM
jgi:hypothetical protein